MGTGEHGEHGDTVEGSFPAPLLVVLAYNCEGGLVNLPAQKLFIKIVNNILVIIMPS